jgi:hypothetical protein
MINWESVITAGTREAQLGTDLPYFAQELLRIIPKAGGLAEPFVFNKAQLRLHDILEEQLARTGMVRAVILKGRQLGISSYTAARFFKKTLETPGFRTSIIAHQRSASAHLFGIVKRFADLMPEDRRPSIGTSNAESLVFDATNSSYAVSVATESGAGRSSTSQLVHGSEVAFWPDLAEQIASLLQTVPRTPGSEIILETTADKFGDAFHQFWRRAESGTGEFLPIFLPWSLADEYRIPV